MLKENFEYNQNVKANTDLINSLKSNYPEFFTASKHDENGGLVSGSTFDLNKFIEALKEQNIDELSSGYRLDFIGKNYAKKQSGERPTTVIVPDKTHNERIENKDSKNLFFTGDNLEVLRHLQQNYTNSIDVIYIDPPYNTGSDGFVYPDKFEYSDEQLTDMFGLSEEELQRLKSIQGKSTHSAWLTFMYPRLYLSKKLLKDEGVIFVSIDDNEQANLKLLMDDIFGEGSFETTLVVEMSKTQGMKVAAAQKGKIVKNKEYILIYQENMSTEVNRNVLYDFVAGYDTHYSKFINSDGYVVQLIDVLKNEKSLSGEISRLTKYKNLTLNNVGYFIDNSGDIKNFIEDNADNIYRVNNASIFIPEDVKNTITSAELPVSYKSSEDGKLYKLIKVGDNTISQLISLSSSYNDTDGYYPKFGRSTIRGDWWKDFNLDMVNVSGEDGVEYKNGKKLLRLIKQLIKWSGVKDGIVLDFFAGSATTASAVLNYNAETSANNQYIMVQLPENLDERIKTVNADAKKDAQKLVKFLDMHNRPHSINQMSMQRIENAAENIKNIYGNKMADLDLGFKHYSVIEPNHDALSELDYSGAQQISYFDDMISVYSGESLQAVGNASGKDTILLTYLAKDGYKFDVDINMLEFSDIEIPYVNSQRIYIIENDWKAENTKALVNAIGTNQITVQTIVVYGHSIQMESLRELEIALNQLDKNINLLIRY